MPNLQNRTTHISYILRFNLSAQVVHVNWEYNQKNTPVIYDSKIRWNQGGFASLKCRKLDFYHLSLFFPFILATHPTPPALLLFRQLTLNCRFINDKRQSESEVQMKYLTDASSEKGVSHWNISNVLLYTIPTNIKQSLLERRAIMIPPGYQFSDTYATLSPKRVEISGLQSLRVKRTTSHLIQKNANILHPWI
jgi:hypothetical protein